MVYIQILSTKELEDMADSVNETCYVYIFKAIRMRHEIERETKSKSPTD